MVDSARQRMIDIDENAPSYLPPDIDTDSTLHYIPIHCRYEAELNGPASISDIDTTAFCTTDMNNVFAYQELDSETMNCIYALLGRLFYDIGRHDDWQLLLIIKGVAGSGKSSIIELFSSLFHADSTATLAGNMQATTSIPTTSTPITTTSNSFPIAIPPSPPPS